MLSHTYVPQTFALACSQGICKVKLLISIFNTILLTCSEILAQMMHATSFSKLNHQKSEDRYLFYCTVTRLYKNQFDRGFISPFHTYRRTHKRRYRHTNRYNRQWKCTLLISLLPATSFMKQSLSSIDFGNQLNVIKFSFQPVIHFKRSLQEMFTTQVMFQVSELFILILKIRKYFPLLDLQRFLAFG